MSEQTKIFANSNAQCIHSQTILMVCSGPPDPSFESASALILRQGASGVMAATGQQSGRAQLAGGGTSLPL